MTPIPAEDLPVIKQSSQYRVLVQIELEKYLGSFQLSVNRRGKSHSGDAGMRSYDLPAVGKLLEVHDAVSHHLLLGAWKRDRPPSQG